MKHEAGVTDEKMWMFTMVTMEKSVHHVKILQYENKTGSMTEGGTFQNMLMVAAEGETHADVQPSRRNLMHKREHSADFDLYLEANDWSNWTNGSTTPGEHSRKRIRCGN